MRSILPIVYYKWALLKFTLAIATILKKIMSDKKTVDKNTAELFTELVEVIRKLRDPNGGCPWDLEQTHQTLKPYLIEETYEVLEAIDEGDHKEFCAELGDLLLQVVLHSQIAKDSKTFSIDEVIKAVTEKMIRRHPHVFGESKLSNSAEVLKNWEALKSAEKKEAGKEESLKKSLFDGIPKSLPALVRAQRIGEKATRANFDWDNTMQVWEKVQEELKELSEVISALDLTHKNPQTTAPTDREHAIHLHLEEEMGDLLFSLTQLSRWLGVSAENALRATIDKFFARFNHMEENSQISLDKMNKQELDVLWQSAKKSLKK